MRLLALWVSTMGFILLLIFNKSCWICYYFFSKFRMVTGKFCWFVSIHQKLFIIGRLVLLVDNTP